MYAIKDNVMSINEGEYTIALDLDGAKRKGDRLWYTFTFSHGDKVIVPEGAEYGTFSPSPMIDDLFGLFEVAAYFMCVNHDDGVDDDFFAGMTAEHLEWIDSGEQEEFSSWYYDIFDGDES